MSTRGILQELPSRENCFATRKKKTVLLEYRPSEMRLSMSIVRHSVSYHTP